MPIFGNTTIGTSGNSDLSNTLQAYKVTTPSTDITNAYLKSITLYTSAESQVATVIWGLYSDRGGVLADTKILYQTTGNSYAAGIGWQETTQPFIAAVNPVTSETFPTALSGSTTYWLVSLATTIAAATPRSRWNTVGTVEKLVSSYNYTNYPTLPVDFGAAETSFTRRVSVYATYYVAETDTITSDAVIASGGQEPTEDTVTIYSDGHIKGSDTTTITSD